MGGSREMVVQWARVLVCSTITILRTPDTTPWPLPMHTGTDPPPPKPLDTLIKE